MEGRPKPRPGESPSATYRIVMPGYFETMRLPVRRGRAIAYSDDARAPGVVIINERAAAEYWPGEDPLGKRITFDDDQNDRPAWLTVIGVTANAKQSEMSSEPYPEVYLAALQNRTYLTDGKPQRAYITLVVRTAGDPADLAPAVKQAVWSFERNLPISDVLTMDQVVADANAQPRFVMLLLAVFAAVALLLAAVGIYGVMSYSVSRRTHEIGIRMSLGARPADVLWLVVRQGWRRHWRARRQASWGAAVVKLMAKMLYGVQPTDPVTFTGVAGILVLVAARASRALSSGAQS
jgi:putative ABC transport system permease protein